MTLYSPPKIPKFVFVNSGTRRKTSSKFNVPNMRKIINIPIASLSGGLLLFLYCLFQKFEIS